MAIGEHQGTLTKVVAVAMNEAAIALNDGARDLQRGELHGSEACQTPAASARFQMRRHLRRSSGGERQTEVNAWPRRGHLEEAGGQVLATGKEQDSHDTSFS
jgi:hypothetical protein